MNISQNKKEQQKQKSVQQPSAVESDGKSDSGSENDSNASPTANDGKVHVEFTEEEIIAPETNTVQYKVISDYHKLLIYLRFNSWYSNVENILKFFFGCYAWYSNI